MAGKPVLYTKFLGTYNLENQTAGALYAKELAKNTLEYKASTFLQKGYNTVIDKFYKLKRRDGYSLLSAGRFGSLHPIPSSNKLFAVKNGDLKSITLSPYAETMVLSGVGNNTMSYADYMGRTYYTNGTIIRYGEAATEIPQLTVDSTTENIENNFLRPLPPGQIIEAWNGRLLVAVGGIVIISEAWSDYYDVRVDRSLWNIGGTITMLKGVTDGVYVSNETNVYFMKGLDASDVTTMDVSSFGAYPGSAQSVTNIVSMKNESTTYDRAVLWTSKEGFCAGCDGGDHFVYTDKWYYMPQATRAAGVVIKGIDNKTDQYIVSLRN